jgi:hypothetical protein
MKNEPNMCLECGSRNVRVWRTPDKKLFWVACDKCGRTSRTLAKHDEDALIAQWNADNPEACLTPLGEKDLVSLYLLLVEGKSVDELMQATGRPSLFALVCFNSRNV